MTVSTPGPAARRAAALAEMEARQLDALVACSPEAVLWLSGAVIPTQKSMRDRLSMVVLSAATNDGLLITSKVEKNLARRQSDLGVDTFTEFVDQPIVASVQKLLGLDPTATRIGIETDYLPAARFAELVEAFPGLAFEGLGGWFSALREVKDASEIELLTALALDAQQVVHESFRAAAAGITERQLLDDMVDRGTSRGRALNHGTLSAGANISLNHHRAGATPLAEGDLVRIDFGFIAGGYISDIARMAVVGEPTIEQRRRYAFIVDSERWMIDQLRPGTDTVALFDAWHERLAAEGATTSMALIAHNIGLALHETPMVTPYAPAELLPGMVFCVEPIVEYDDGEVYHVEDLILVTSDGAEYLTDPHDADELTIIQNSGAEQAPSTTEAENA